MGSSYAPTPASASSKSEWSLQTALSDVAKPATAVSSSPLAFLHILERLKTTPREGWRRHEINNGESISDHMYRMSIISMLCPDPTLKKDHCIKMALVHDMAEALVGDITPLDNVPKDEKHSREIQTMEYLTEKLVSPSNPAAAMEIMSLWKEYEDSITPESIFVHDVDKFELICQMIEYEKKYEPPKDLSEFLGVAGRVQTPYVKKWVSDALEERDSFWRERGVVTEGKD